MKKGLVSIITPAYNASKYIKETIESVLNQTYDNWELIVINDGSTDDTEKIVNSFKDSRIKLINQENMGVSAARNRGLSEAQGEFITFLDADDILPPNSLEARVKYLQENSDIDLIHGLEINFIHPNINNTYKIYDTFALDDLYKRILQLDSNISFTPGYLLRMDSIKDTTFNEGMTHSEDMLYLLKLLKKGIKYSSISKKTYFYRVAHNSAMSNLEGWRRGYFKLLQELRNEGIDYKETILMRIKIAKMLMLYHIRNKNLKGLLDLFRVWK